MKFYKRLRLFLLFTILFLSGTNSFAQYYIIGQNPASVKWKQIDSENFKIIFPTGYEDKAANYVNLLEYSRLAISQSYLVKSKKFKIVLHNRTTTSNAMVSPTPMHADFFEIPDQNTYAQLWDRQLTLHEYRHAVQIQKMNQGLTRGLYYVFGDQALAAIMGIFLPFWFIEGDAVFSETVYSKSGRGRSPDFSMDLKAQILDKKVYSYDKALYGSFKNYTPDHYTLGYQIVLNANLKYGNNIWNDALNKVARRPYVIVPFSSAIKKYHGKGKVGLYTSTMEELKNTWHEEDSSLILKDNFIDQPKPKYFTNYKFPVSVNDSTIIALKTGIDDINRFVIIGSDGKEEILFTPGFSFNKSLSANDSLICWNEKSYDPRWEMRNYAIIKIYNYKTSKTKILSKRSRYFAPQLSNDGKMVCAVEVTEDNNYFIVVIDIETQEVIKLFSTEENLFLSTPQWSSDDESIISVAVGEKGKIIVSFNVEDGKVEYLGDFTFDDIKFASINKDKLIFTAPFGETNNIYLKDLKTKNTYKLTNTRFDASGIKFSSNGEHIYFSEYTADGYRVSKISSNPTEEQLVDYKHLKTSFAIDELTLESNFILDDSIIPNSKSEVKKYSKSGHLFNLHSWAPLGIDIDNFTVSPGVTLMSQNLLSSSIGTLGYYYDLNEETGKVKFNYDYYGWYPVIKLGVEYAGRRQFHFNEDSQEYDEVRFNETNISAGVSLPLNFTRSKWIKGMQPYVGVTQQFLKMHKDSKYTFNTDQFTSLTYQFYAYNQLKRSVRDIFPKWGQSLNLVYRHTPFGQMTNNQFYSSMYFYLPSIINHHGIRLYAAYQKTEVSNYPYANQLSISRGYTNLSFSEMLSFKSDYALPIIYPDLAIPSVLFLKRIHGRVFYDFTNGLESNEWKYYSSTGAEIYSDWHILGLPVVVTLGGRASYKIESSSIVYEFLFGLGY